MLSKHLYRAIAAGLVACSVVPTRGQVTVLAYGEIVMVVEGLEDSTLGWSVTASIDRRDNIRWTWDGDECRLTDGFARVQVRGTGNSQSQDNFRSPKLMDSYSLAWGLYNFRWDMPEGYPDTEFCLDLRDADWAEGYWPEPDLYIRYADTAGTGEWSLGWSHHQHGPYQPLKGNIWDAWGRSAPNQWPFRPTGPQDFTCVNNGRAGENPTFTWYWPEAPNELMDWPYCFSYSIYRSENFGPFYYVASGLSYGPGTPLPFSWTDNSVMMWPGGGRYLYYCTATTGESPESPPSDEVAVRGNPYKVLPGEGEEPAADVSGQVQVRSVGLWCSPNPCNAVVGVWYCLPREGRVQLALYDLGGAEVAELARGVEGAGVHRVSYSLDALPSGLYVVRLVFRDRGVSQKVAVVK
ncbi:MAG: T9SS type A sorting domain-containing protein [Calditrichaeota bacterium]|nr:T9SS type A sorting domain-containing protein [Calditrichota bacterium]